MSSIPPLVLNPHKVARNQMSVRAHDIVISFLTDRTDENVNLWHVDLATFRQRVYNRKAAGSLSE